MAEKHVLHSLKRAGMVGTPAPVVEGSVNRTGQELAVHLGFLSSVFLLDIAHLSFGELSTPSPRGSTNGDCDNDTVAPAYCKFINQPQTKNIWKTMSLY
jgi:hypothetical protein